MCGNRVEELETRVQELEASVEGLTDELVECKVRIRELENTVDEQNGFSRSPPEQAGEKDTDGSAASEAADSEETSTESEILVPEVGDDTAEAGTSNTEAPEETDNTADPEADAESETEVDSGSDIIVA